MVGSTSAKQVIPGVDDCMHIWAELKRSACFIDRPLRNFKFPYDLDCLRSISVEDVMRAGKYLVST